MADFLRIAVIMAGGSGERFWPLSRRHRPKQLLRLATDQQTLLEEAIERIEPLVPPERIFVITAAALVTPIREAHTGLPDENILGEPAKRNTAGALTWAAAHILANFAAQSAEKTSIAVLTADHRIGDRQGFAATVQSALTAAEQTGALVTIGVPPERPETGFGYIEVPPDATPLLATDPPVLPVARFLEKPDRPTAEAFLRDGRHFWNSGMFFWRLDRFLEELNGSAPAHAQAALSMALAMANRDPEAAARIFTELEDISIDYALMERAGRVAMARAAFDWDDVGAWDALDRNRARDAAGNVAVGDPVLVDSRDCIVYNAEGADAIAVGVVGMEGVVVVVSRDGVLVVPKDRAQDVKQVVGQLKKRGAKQL
ncbi:MAG: Alginate biosynthesis protein AlgA [candidate division BRC1 bacterium ADurb.BinA292]|nr:MAG: Alginate biosynthesis protein AlgA [candidate division BRC1 bacterium ADurb.BinA292]